ncbi:hypothetical protein HHL28_17605 [Aerophototrophica crusticola]|uniref:Uncharacterized protein n=1 Tax=Aerophototrophica crusticola TaxID=1709002 RepID=A0A858RB58_9PROT|nr:hypothetical protein HHL28_17605 [Rhodospirillaceae bacterium B3]
MWDEATNDDPAAEWSPVALRGGAASLKLPSGWRRLSRDDGGLAFQSPGPNPVDLLVSITTYRNPYGVKAEEAIQYLDRENVLPHGIAPSEDAEDDRRWIAYAVTQPPDRQIFVWKVADFQPPDTVRVVTVQLLVPETSAAAPDLEELIDRLGEEAARVEFHDPTAPVPVTPVTMRNVAHGENVRFRLPWDWQVEMEGELSVFFREEADTGTLRVAVHAFPHTAEGGEALAQMVLRQTAEQFADGPDGRVGKGSLEFLREGEVLARFSTEGEEDGEKLYFHLWLRGSAADGQTTLALFSLAMPRDRGGSDLERATLAMLETEIRNAALGPGAEEVEDDDEPDEEGTA